MLDVTRELHNALLEKRREAFRRRGITISTKAQYAELTALRHADARVAATLRQAQCATFFTNAMRDTLSRI